MKEYPDTSTNENSNEDPEFWKIYLFALVIAGILITLLIRA